jgi:hypothetical protein
MAVDAGVLTVGHWSRPWLAWLDGAIAREIERLRARYELSRDEFYGLYISDEQVDRLLAPEAEGVLGPDAPPAYEPTPLGKVQSEFTLLADEVCTLVVALAPELDTKYEALYAYLNDDVTRRAPTIDTCVRLIGAPVERFDDDAPLVREGLLDVGPAEHWRSSSLHASRPLRRFLTASQVVPRLPLTADDGALRARLDRGLTTIVLVGRTDDARRAARATAGGHRLLETTSAPIADALLTARLHDAWAWFGPEMLDDPGLRRACETPTVTFFCAPTLGAVAERFADSDHEVVHLTPPNASARECLWREALRTPVTDDDVRTVAHLFALGPAQIRRAAAAVNRGDLADVAALARHARIQSNESFGPLAHAVEPLHGWQDLVLPRATMTRLREFAAAIRNRERVFHDWSLARQAGGSSLRALFSGASGTGKTLAAGVVARELGLDLFRIDLAAVVSKYIGETEKNLDRVFASADGSNAILFFDEADALFGKRSEVKDAHDRYANVEIAYLLQRIEQYDGVLILATNLAMNMDEAFSRRIHFEIEFPFPDEELRGCLWRTLLAGAPTTDDVDDGFLARHFALTGGDIRNIVVSAAFLAAHEDTTIGMSQVVRAVGRHRRRQGKVPSATEFKEYLRLVTADGG